MNDLAKEIKNILSDELPISNKYAGKITEKVIEKITEKIKKENDIGAILQNKMLMAIIKSQQELLDSLLNVKKETEFIQNENGTVKIEKYEPEIKRGFKGVWIHKHHNGGVVNG